MKWTWTINIVTVVCDLNKVGLKALIYCHHGVKWDEALGSRQSTVTLFPRIIAIPQIIASLK